MTPAHDDTRNDGRDTYKDKGLVDGVSWFVFQIVHNYYDVEISVWIGHLNVITTATLVGKKVNLLTFFCRIPQF